MFQIPAISTVKVDFLPTCCNRKLEFSVIRCGDRMRNNLNLHSRLEHGVGWTSQKDYCDVLFKGTCFTMCASFSLCLSNEHSGQDAFMAWIYKGRQSEIYSQRAEGKMSLTFINKEKVGNVRDCGMQRAESFACTWYRGN